MEYILLELCDNHYLSRYSSNPDIGILGAFFSTDAGYTPGWEEWIVNDDLGTEVSGNRTYIKKKGPDLYIGNLYDGRKKKTKFKISQKNLLHILQGWYAAVHNRNSKYIIIVHAIENETFTVYTSNDEVSPLELLKKMNLTKRYIKLALKSSKKYGWEDMSDMIIANLSSFLEQEIQCSGQLWKEWIINDSGHLQKDGNFTAVTKKDNFIYLDCLYPPRGNPFIIKRDQLIQLLDDWSEKVCKAKPQHVTITYDNDIFTIETS